MIESTNLKYFNKEMIAEFFALKGTYLFRIGRLVGIASLVFVLLLC